MPAYNFFAIAVADDNSKNTQDKAYHVIIANSNNKSGGKQVGWLFFDGLSCVSLLYIATQIYTMLYNWHH